MGNLTQERNTVEYSGISCLLVKKNKILGYTLCQVVLFWVTILELFFLEVKKPGQALGIILLASFRKS